MTTTEILERITVAIGKLQQMDAFLTPVQANVETDIFEHIVNTSYALSEAMDGFTELYKAIEASDKGGESK